MSLPVELRNWISCPGCGECEDIWRLGNVGVPEKNYGSRKRTKDSNRFRCGACKERFTSDGATRRENMGFNVSGRDVTAIQGDPA